MPECHIYIQVVPLNYITSRIGLKRSHSVKTVLHKRRFCKRFDGKANHGANLGRERKHTDTSSFEMVGHTSLHKRAKVVQ